MVRIGCWLFVALLAACSGSHDAKPSTSHETVTASSERAAARLRRDLSGIRGRPRTADGDDPLARRGRSAFAGMVQRFDANGDGTLDADERKAMRDERTARMMSSVDGDGDGRLSQAELEAADNPRLRRLVENFATIDADGDSKLSTDEIAAAMPARGAFGRRGDRRGRGRWGGGAARPADGAAEGTTP